MNDKDFERYENLFQAYSDRLISYNEYMKQKPKQRNWVGAVKEYAIAMTKYYLVRIASLRK